MTCCSTVRPAGILSDRVVNKKKSLDKATSSLWGRKTNLRGSCCIIGGAREAGLGLDVGRTGSIAKPGKADAWEHKC